MIIAFHEPFARGILLLWGFGTLYMCCFALFVGMTRKYILREGTLFFIRSPDDPNTRLVHDALMKPLHIQLWRISQSALVYTLFIAVGIGGITHGLKAMDSQLIPVRTNLLIVPIPAFWLTWLVIDNSSLLKKYVRQYWTRAFKACAAQLRLSSFILGKHDPKERGHVVYRNIMTMVQGAKPDYTHPSTTEESKDIFKTTDAKAVFVPDGYHVRAPKFDMASRPYIRTLFVPVTKDDIPLNPDAPPNASRDFEFDDESGEEDNRFDEYEVVYRPPNFGIRIIGLIVMLSVFAIILFSGSIIASNILGRPLAFALEYVTDSLGFNYFAVLAGVPLSFFSVQLDTGSVIIGLFGILLLLKKYDELVIRQHLDGNPGVGDQIVQGANARDRFFRLFVDMCVVTGNLIGGIICIIALLFWCQMMHQRCNDSFHYFSGFEDEHLIYYGLHAALGLFYTFRPIQSIIAHEIKELVHNTIQSGIHLASEGIWRRLGGAAVVIYNSSISVIGILQFSVVLFEYFTNPTQYSGILDVIHQVGLKHKAQRGALLAITPMVVVGNLIYKFYGRASGLYKSLNAQVKEQYYARGKTLENAHIDDQSTALAPAPAPAPAPVHDANEVPVEEPLDP